MGLILFILSLYPMQVEYGNGIGWLAGIARVLVTIKSLCASVAIKQRQRKRRRGGVSRIDGQQRTIVGEVALHAAWLARLFSNPNLARSRGAASGEIDHRHR